MKQAVRSLKAGVAAGENGVSLADDQASETLEKMSGLQALVKGLSWTVGRKRGGHAGIVDIQWHAPGWSLLPSYQSVKAGSEKQYARCLTIYLSSYLWLRFVCQQGLNLTRLWSC